MADYRIYVLDKDDHVREPPEIIDCPDDDTAVGKATQLLDGHVIEVWERARLIVRLEPTDKRQSQ